MICDLLALVDEAALEDVVTIVDGVPDAPANGFSEGEAVMLDALVGEPV